MALVDAWLLLPTPALFGVLLLLLGGNAAALYGLVFHTRAGRWLQRCTGIVAPFFGSVAILFSLLTGFLANDVWERNRQAARSVLTESDNIRALWNLSIASASDMADIRQAMLAYVRSVIQDEWPSMAQNASAASTEAALGTLLQRVSEPRITQESGAPVHNALLARVMLIGSARHDRLVLGEDQSDELKWLAVILLALFTQAAIGAVHLERARAFVLTLVLFTTASTVTLGLIAMREHPFATPQLTQPSALQTWLREVEPKP